MDEIDRVFVTLDSHHREHIAHASVWQDRKGQEPPSFQRISHSDVQQGVWRPKDPSLQAHCEAYTRTLEEKGRFVLTIWPEHCIIGSVGHAIYPLLQLALDRWQQAHPQQSIQCIRKGSNDLTEMYSALIAEVPVAADLDTQLNTQFLAQLQSCPKLLVCGQALSHCVNYTVRDLLSHWMPRNAGDITLLIDGKNLSVHIAQCSVYDVPCM